MRDSDAQLFETKEQLIEHCKDNGIMLFAALGGENDPLHVAKRMNLRTGGIQIHDSSYQLLSATPSASSNGLTSNGTHLYVPFELLGALNTDLQDDKSPIRRLSSWPISRTFVCIDVSDFSKIPAGHQALLISSINKIVREEDWPIAKIGTYLEAQLCIGDGYIYVCSDPRLATFFGARLAHLIDRAVAEKQVPVEFHYRMGIHVGEVHTFWDPGRNNWNYIGDGINGATRVLQAIGKDVDDVVFVSGKIREQFLGDPNEDPMLHSQDTSENLYTVIRDHLDNKGRRKDKHDEIWRVYQMNHTKIGSAPEGWGW